MLHPLVKNKEKDAAENAVITIKKMEGDIKLLKDTVITSKLGQRFGSSTQLSTLCMTGKIGMFV